jgi:hypothetical protein
MHLKLKSPYILQKKGQFTVALDRAYIHTARTTNAHGATFLFHASIPITEDSLMLTNKAKPYGDSKPTAIATQQTQMRTGTCFFNQSKQGYFVRFHHKVSASALHLKSTYMQN